MSQGERNTSIQMIKEKMKEKRRKKALNDSNTSLSRSRSNRKGGTNASLILKASLRSNNQALAKSLSVSKHEVHQANQIILDYQRERQDLMHQANMRRQSEKECLNRFNNIKVVLTKATTSLCDVVTSLGQALDLCSSLPIRESSLGICRSSLTSDDDSFGIWPKTENGSSFCRKADVMSKTIESTSSDLMQVVDLVATTPIENTPISNLTQSNEVNETSRLDFKVPMECEDLPLMFTNEPWLKDDVVSQSPPRPSEAPMKRSRTAALLDPVAIQKALTEPTIHDKGNHDHGNQPNLPKTVSPSPGNQKQVSSNKQSVNKLPRVTFNSPVKSQKMSHDTEPLPEVNEQFQPIVPNKERYVFVHSPCEVTTYTAVDMELTAAINSSVSPSQGDQSKTQDNRSFINHDDRVIRPWGNIQMEDSSRDDNITSAKSSNMKRQESSSKTDLPKAKKRSGNKSGKLQSSKPMKKETKKACHKSKKSSWMSDSLKNDLAVFDLSAGDSFSLPTPQLKQMATKHCNTIIASNKNKDDSQHVTEPLYNEMLLPKDSDPNTAKICPGNDGCIKPTDDKESTEAHSITPTSPGHHLHSKTVEKAVQIKRQSKKARYVVTPGLSTKEKQKIKAGNKKSSSKIPLSSLTNDMIPCDISHDPSNVPVDTDDIHVHTTQKGQSVRVKGDCRKSSHEASCNAALQQASVTLYNDDKHISQQSTKRLKRLADEENKMEVNDAEETIKRPRRGAPVCYKEPSLLRKMRSESAEKTKKKVNKKGKGIKRQALGTVTNVM